MKGWITPNGTMLTDLRDTKNNPDWYKYLNLGEWVAPYELPSDELVHTYFLWYCADITSKAAAVLGYSNDAAQYAQMAIDVREAFHSRFYNTESKSYGDYGSNIFALAMGVPESCREDVVATLENELKVKYSSHLNTGIFGTRLLFETLARYGLNDLAYEIINQRDFPSFGYWIEQGATSTWECWDGQNSHNHPMFGGGLTWLYNTLAGVKVDEQMPGFKHIVVKPTIVNDLTDVHYSKMTPQGVVSSTISHNNGSGLLKVVIPVGSTATIHLPNGVVHNVVQGSYEFGF
jgi:alpha-L-rhamnosidase